MSERLIVYDLRGLSRSKKVQVNRELFGYIDISHKGKYKYKRKGILTNVPHFKIFDAAVIIRRRDERKIIRFLKKSKVKYSSYKIYVKSSLLKRS